MKITDEAVGVNEDALRALAKAYDREDAAQRGTVRNEKSHGNSHGCSPRVLIPDSLPLGNGVYWEREFSPNGQ